VEEFRILKEFFSLLENTKYDNLASTLINLSLSTNTTFDMIRFFIYDEFEANHGESVMRENCVASKIVKAYLRKIGRNYLAETIGKIIIQIVVTERKTSLEIDPSKVDKRQIERNMKHLKNKVRDIINALTSQEALNKMPVGIRIIAQYFRDCSLKYLPNSNFHVMIGSFIMLRYINPAIFTPENAHLLPKGKTPSSTTRRNLILITKILQVGCVWVFVGS